MGRRVATGDRLAYYLIEFGLDCNGVKDVGVCSECDRAIGEFGADMDKGGRSAALIHV